MYKNLPTPEYYSLTKEQQKEAAIKCMSIEVEKVLKRISG